MYTLQFDGMLWSSGNDWPKPFGLLGYGWLIYHHSTKIAHGYGVFLRPRRAGSNAAEYLALIDGLEALADLGIRWEAVEIRGDAKCVIDQMTGAAAVSSPLTRVLHRRTRRRAQQFRNLTWTWVPRQENQYADRLSRRSFHYLHYSSHLAQYVDRPSVYPGDFIPLVDLRVLSPISPSANRLSNRVGGPKEERNSLLMSGKR